MTRTVRLFRDCLHVRGSTLPTSQVNVAGRPSIAVRGLARFEVWRGGQMLIHTILSPLCVPLRPLSFYGMALCLLAVISSATIARHYRGHSRTGVGIGTYRPPAAVPCPLCGGFSPFSNANSHNILLVFLSLVLAERVSLDQAACGRHRAVIVTSGSLSNAERRGEGES